MSTSAPRSLLLALVGFCALGYVAWADGRPAAEFSFHRDHVIGTSFDLWVTAPDEPTAERAEEAALAEIERLRLVFSTYDPTSEISRVNRAAGPVAVSADMAAVLRAYDVWQQKSGGAFHAQVGELVRVWKDAEKAGREPDPATLERIAGELRRPGWELDAATHTLTRLTDQPLNLNAIAKAFIIQRAVAAVREKVPAVTGVLLNLGGDLLAWGSPASGSGWPVAVQDPFRPEENAMPIAGLRLANQAVATSGGYQRFYTIGGKRYSHIFDPRTGRPAEGVAGATVIAPDNVTANALATTLCVLPPDEGLRLVATVPGAGCLIVAADGRRFTSPGLKLLDIHPTRAIAASATEQAKGDPWPEGFQVTIGVELPKIESARYRRPYVAVWVEDAEGKAVRTLTVWGNSQKYLKDLGDWWKIGRGDADLVKAVTRATRGPGKYDVVWDGKDDKGNAVSQGTYTVRVEVHREFGKHLRQSGKIECKADGAKVTLDKNEETEATQVEYGKKK